MQVSYKTTYKTQYTKTFSTRFRIGCFLLHKYLSYGIAEFDRAVSVMTDWAFLVPVYNTVHNKIRSEQE